MWTTFLALPIYIRINFNFAVPRYFIILKSLILGHSFNISVQFPDSIIQMTKNISVCQEQPYFTKLNNLINRSTEHQTKTV